jgi:hypothetical protein
VIKAQKGYKKGRNGMRDEDTKQVILPDRLNLCM